MRRSRWLVPFVCSLIFIPLVAGDMPRKGGQAIAFKARTMDGKDINFPADYKGKIVLLDFWATWCGPCVEEVPGVVKAYQKYHPQGLEILGVSLDKPDGGATVRKVMAEKHMTWNMILSKNEFKGHIPEIYGVNLIPSAFLIDGDTGKIIAGAQGALRGENLPRTLEAAFSSRAGGNAVK